MLETRENPRIGPANYKLIISERTFEPYVRSGQLLQIINFSRIETIYSICLFCVNENLLNVRIFSVKLIEPQGVFVTMRL
jgi:hypothetical protein